MTIPTLDVPVRPAYKTKWLFHQPDFLKINTGEQLRTFYQYNEKEVLGMLRCLLDGSSADAARNTFYGCMELENGVQAGKFIQYVTSELQEGAVNSLSMTLFPRQYDPAAWTMQRNALQENDFNIEGSITHRLIPVSADDDEQLASNDWRSAANNITDYSVTQEPLDQYHKITKLIRLSETIDEANGDDSLVDYCISHLPEHTMVFAVRDGARYCGAGVFLEIGPGILYTLQLLQIGEYDDRRPLTALFQFIYEWAELHDLRYIDLGQIASLVQDNIGMIQGTAERWVRKW